MATKLEHISHILEEVWKDLEELNKRFDERERAKNESTTVLRPGDDATPSRTSTTGEKDEL